jgi:hypothetical protein
MRATAIDAVGNALRDAGGRANTATLCAALPHLDRATIHQSLAHLKRRCIIDSDYAPARTPEGGWTYWFIARLTAVRGSRYRAAVSAGFTRVICEWLDAQGGEASIEAWREWSGNIANRIRLNSAIHSLRRRGLAEWGSKRVALTEGGKAALRTGRQVAPIAPRAEDFDDEPEIRQKQASTDPEVSIARAEKLWPKLLAGRRFEDIPAHLIRPLAVLRWTPPISARSLTGSSGAMLAESRSTIGTTP